MTDLELITRVKDSNDSIAMKQLIDNHTGIYINTVNTFSLPQSLANEVKEDLYFNINKFLIAYNPAHNMKFGTYVCERTKFMCLNLINRGTESVGFIENDQANNDTETTETVMQKDTKTEMTERAKKVGDPRFYEIFKLRFAERPLTWRAIGKELKISQEGARKVFNRHIGKLQEYAKT